MDMKNPPHPGELVGDNLTALGVSIMDAAKALSISRQQLHNVTAGRDAITPEMAVRLEKAWQQRRHTARHANELRSGANSGRGLVAQGHAAGSGVNAVSLLSTQPVNV